MWGFRRPQLTSNAIAKHPIGSAIHKRSESCGRPVHNNSARIAIIPNLARDHFQRHTDLDVPAVQVGQQDCSWCEPASLNRQVSPWWKRPNSGRIAYFRYGAYPTVPAQPCESNAQSAPHPRRIFLDIDQDTIRRYCQPRHN